jgi:hypothetical protein
MRQRLCLLILVVGSLSSFVGCLIPAYSALPTRRAEELIYSSENMRALVDEWERFWLLDQPSHLSPYRVHGGVI